MATAIFLSRSAPGRPKGVGIRANLPPQIFRLRIADQPETSADLHHDPLNIVDLIRSWAWNRKVLTKSWGT
jgi:hypothetical protein